MSKAVRKVALVAAGAALGFVTGGVGFALIGGAVGLFVGSQQDAALKTGRAGNSEPSAQTVRSSKAPARFILGRVSTGGVLVWAQEQSGDQTDGEWVHLVYVLSEGAVDALEEIYLGEELINTFGEFASYELVVNPTQVNAFLRANCPDWKDTQIGRGVSFVRLSLKHNSEKFPSGIPNVRFVVRGRNDLYDPRTGMTGYSENTALHLLWFLRTRCKVPDDEIVFETFASAANVCDESVGNPDGSSGIRYRTGCVIGADEQRTNVIQKLEESCAGQLIRVGGKWMLQAGAYYGPWDFEITEDMVIGTVSGSTEVGNDAAINVVTGTFVDPSQSWAETDFPEVRVQAWVDQDGGESAESMSLGYVTDAYQGQRLANIKLRRARAAGSLQIPMNFAGYNCRPGRVVRVNLPSLNIVGEFIVTDWNLAADNGCTVTVSQYEAAIFDDAVGQPYNPIGFISLPSGGLGSPTGLAWTVDDTAEVTQGVLSWDAPAGIVSGYAVTVRQAGVAVQAQQVPETTLQLPLAGLPSGNYTMSVAALGPQARSGEASITVNIDGPPVPEGCIVQASLDTITLTPTNVQHKLNGGTYEYFYTRDGSAPVGQAEYVGQGLSLTHTGLAFFANYFYFIRARNAYGISGYLKVPASTSNDVSNMLDALDGQIREGQLYPELAERIDLIDGNGPGSVNERIGELRDEIDDLVDALAYDPNKAYADGDSVRRGQRLYQAIQAVPAAPGGENAPPNPTYWLDIGQVVEAANGLAAQVERNTASIEEQDGRITVNAQRLAAVRSELDDPVTGLSATANGLSSMKSEVETIDGKLNATAERLDGVYVQVNPALAGTTDGFAGSEQTLVGVWSEQSARIEDGIATARRLDVVQAQQGETNASVQRVDQAVVGLNGKVSAMSSWKTETNVNGKQVATGIVQGSDGQVGEILLSADRVAIINGINGPESNLFVFQNGQLFLNQALINTAFIREIILGMTLRSQAVDAFGRPLIELNMVNGTFSFRGADGNGSLLINNGGVYVYDLNYIERAALGKLT
ncbi:phage tail tip fiber protein [Pseudomonas sp. A014]|uniref:phage tail tip fiber protein n=1 Tax=Pseudomonas sp. A014 TaxID=3458058 RepID=UPI004035C3CC